MLPKKGRRFPNNGSRRPNSGKFAGEISRALRAELGGSHQTIKTLMNWTRASERTIKNWLSGSHGPNGAHLIEMIRHSDAVCSLVLRMAGRNGALTAIRLTDLRTRMVRIIAEIDRLGEEACS